MKGETTLIFATADLCDRYEQELRTGQLRILAPMLRPFGGRRSFHGSIETLKLFEDNSWVRRALEQPGLGRVLVIDGGGSRRRALVGDQLALLATNNGWSGIVVNGCIRDSAAIAGMDIGVLALGTHPRKTDKNNVGQAGVALAFGNVAFHPGEWLYADDDGVLVSAVELT
jgi:regulator of ribonuclease activity A